jgi:hypothetical protein
MTRNVARHKMPSSLPSVVERRGLLYGRESQRTDHGAVARRYIEEGRLADALEFFGRGGDADGIREIQRLAVQDGDVFLLLQIERVTQQSLDPEVWREAEHNAERNGKERFARMAAERRGGGDGSDEGTDGR